MSIATDKIAQFNKFGSVLGLERIEELLRRLGNPQKDLKVIHVAGTNGKGSVSRFLYSMLREMGYKVGIYSSPYLEVFNERIEFEGEYISDEELEIYTDQAAAIAKEMSDEGLLSPTEFDVVTAIGFMYFKEKNADIVILEVGLGGIGDSTNVIESPLVSVITSISLDHTDRLGTTLTAIAREKAGIIKSGVPVITNVKDKDARKVIESVAMSKGSESIDLTGSVTTARIKNMDIDGSLVDCEILGESWNNVTVPLLGQHQIENAIVAIATLQYLWQNDLLKCNDKEDTKSDKFTNTDNSNVLKSDAVTLKKTNKQLDVNVKHLLISGIRKTVHKGRFEVVNKTLLTKAAPIYILDGAHNEDGMKSFATTLKRICGDDSKKLIIMGVLKDKDLSKMLANLQDIQADFVATEPDNPRKLEKVLLKEALEKANKQVVAQKYPDEILEYVKNVENKYDIIAFVGSLYLIGTIRRKLHGE